MNFASKDYPNSPLLEYMFKTWLHRNELFLETLKKKKEENKYANISFECFVFPQIWGSTNTGFDVMENGEAVMGGCAMTKAYTTVMHEELTDTWCVFFGNEPCYVVDNPTKEFFEDLNNKNMASRSEAHNRY